MSAELSGNVLVTGGSRGIGRACALAAARRGADVAITYLANREAAEETAEEIRALGRRAAVVQGDVGAVDDNPRMVEEAVAELGPLRYLVANASGSTSGTTRELTVEGWDQTISSHARSLLLLAQAAMPSMSANGGGSIVAITSLGTNRAYKGYAGLGAAKAATESLVVYLAVEGGPDGIRANCVRPGVVITDRFKKKPRWEEIAAAAGEKSPLGRALTPNEIGDPVAFLLSDDARMITGQMIAVDAGFGLPG
ncbi:MAG: SDR family oxidoreductase [Actinobacteria bacterium]|nr:SDR family oxidoreductase [Actinomycetota bacterium]